MISVQEAQEIVFSNLRDFGVEHILLEDSLGRTLRENLRADRDLPPFDRVTMDGIAIKSSDWEKGLRNFTIEGIAPAGQPRINLSKSGNCIEVMTGAVVPLNSDMVIRYEDLSISGGKAQVLIEDLKLSQNIHKKGSDCKENQLLVKVGSKITAAEIGIAASIGKPKIAVSKYPKTLIISTGDELVSIDSQPLAHQIRRSNLYAVQALLGKLLIPADLMHLEDDKLIIEEKLSRALIDYDVLILSGAVSAGKFDYLPEVLNALNVKTLFHKVKQRPGKPFWFGIHESGAIVFALPGNPLSTILCTLKYVLPWLCKSLGQNERVIEQACLNEDIYFNKDLQYFVPVQIQNNLGKLVALPISYQGSGDFSCLAQADAFIELEGEKDIFHKGESYPVHLLR